MSSKTADLASVIFKNPLILKKSRKTIAGRKHPFPFEHGS